MYFLLAEPCSPLTAPANGSMTCTGDQVTNETCTFECDLGYSVEGTAMRVCQADHQWTGVSASCAPKQCPQLEPPDNAAFAGSCDRDYATTCQLVCDRGYFVEESSTIVEWQQSCDQLTGNGTVQWSSSSSCLSK